MGLIENERHEFTQVPHGNQTVGRDMRNDAMQTTKRTTQHGRDIVSAHTGSIGLRMYEVQ